MENTSSVSMAHLFISRVDGIVKSDESLEAKQSKIAELIHNNRDILAACHDPHLVGPLKALADRVKPISEKAAQEIAGFAEITVPIEVREILFRKLAQEYAPEEVVREAAQYRTIDKETVATIAKAMPHVPLTAMGIKRADEAVEFVTRFGAELTYLNVTGIQFTPTTWGQLLAHLPKLREFIAINSGVDGAMAQQLAATVPQLERLDLMHNPALLDQGALAIANLRNLKSLNLINCGLTLAAIQPLLELNRLKSLSLGRSAFRDGVAKILAAADLPHLEELTLNACSLSDLGIETLAQSPLFARLKRLDLDGNAIGERGTEAIARFGKDLEGLSCENTQLSSEGAQRLCSALTNLRDLTLSSNGLTTLPSFAKLPKLQTLKFVGNPIGDQTGPLAGLRIQTLWLFGCEIGPVGAATIATLPALRSLDLSDNPLGDAGVIALTQLQNLEELVLSMAQVTKRGAQAIASLKKLRTLDLSYSDIQLEGAKAIGTLENLRRLKLNHTGLEDEAIRALLTGTGLKKLEKLSLVGSSIEDKMGILLLLQTFEKLRDIQVKE